MGSIPVATVATTSAGRSRNRIGNIGIGGMSDGRVAEHGVGGRIDGTFSEHITIGGMDVSTIATHNIAAGKSAGTARVGGVSSVATNYY